MHPHYPSPFIFVGKRLPASLLFGELQFPARLAVPVQLFFLLDVAPNRKRGSGQSLRLCGSARGSGPRLAAGAVGPPLAHFQSHCVVSLLLRRASMDTLDTIIPRFARPRAARPQEKQKNLSHSLSH